MEYATNGGLWELRVGSLKQVDRKVAFRNVCEGLLCRVFQLIHSINSALKSNGLRGSAMNWIYLKRFFWLMWNKSLFTQVDQEPIKMVKGKKVQYFMPFRNSCSVKWSAIVRRRINLIHSKQTHTHEFKWAVYRRNGWLLCGTPQWSLHVFLCLAYCSGGGKVSLNFALIVLFYQETKSSRGFEEKKPSWY